MLLFHQLVIIPVIVVELVPLPRCVDNLCFCPLIQVVLHAHLVVALFNLIIKLIDNLEVLTDLGLFSRVRCWIVEVLVYDCKVDVLFLHKLKVEWIDKFVGVGRFNARVHFIIIVIIIYFPHEKILQTKLLKWLKALLAVAKVVSALEIFGVDLHFPGVIQDFFIVNNDQVPCHYLPYLIVDEPDQVFGRVDRQKVKLTALVFVIVYQRKSDHLRYLGA